MREKFRQLCTHSLVWTSLIFVLMLSVSGASAQGLIQDPGHSSFLTVENVKFSCPKDFACQRSRADGAAVYIPHLKYDLELVVGVVPFDAGRETIEQLARLAASHVFPKERAPYLWKHLGPDNLIAAGKHVSKFETGNGALQGFNGKQRVVFQYRQVKANDKEVIIGYLFGLGRGGEAKSLFEQNLGGDSMPGWYSQAHIIASLTGEKYTDINPGTEIVIGIDVPAPRKN